jgi:aspartyl protease family protein
MNALIRSILLLALGTLVTPTYATSINVTGLFKDRAMVVIDGAKPRVMAVGETAQGAPLIKRKRPIRCI